MLSLAVPLTLILIVVFSILAGRYVSNSLRMPDHGWKVTAILLVLGMSGVVLATSWPPKQGIDLKGGVILIYEVDESATNMAASTSRGEGKESDQGAGKVDMVALIEALSRRINPGGVQEIVVRRYGDRQVEIIVPDVSSQDVERVKKLITTGGFLRFMLVANSRDHGHLFRLADEPSQVGRYEVIDAEKKVVARWVKLSIKSGTGTPEDPYIYRVDPPGAKSRLIRGRKEVLTVVNSRYDLRGEHLASVRKGYQDLRPVVFFDMTPTGARLMGDLTSSHLPDPSSGHYSLLGIVLDEELISAPRINSTITAHGIIEGDFTEEEVDLLVNVLRAGRLPAVLHKEPISQNIISPLLGEDTIRQGKLSIAISLVAVLVFMVIYYQFAGVVACLALIANLVLILAMMIFIGAAFSLPGLAGLVLTVGMSVDANVLIFERIREELRNGAALRSAIRNGFGRATRTIVDANVTTLITAVVLYLIGTEQLRAFAVTLILGIVMSLFTGIFCSRAVFEIAERQRWIRKLTMLHVLADPKFNLFGKRRLAATLSLVTILVGLGAVSVRGKQIFDIDFLGGTSVQMLLRESMPIAEVRQRADQLRDQGIIDDVSVTEVKSSEHPPETIYRVDTSLPKETAVATPPGGAETEQDQPTVSAVERVQLALIDVFRDEQGQLLLKTHSMQFTQPTRAQPPEPVLPAVNETPAVPDAAIQPLKPETTTTPEATTPDTTTPDTTTPDTTTPEATTPEAASETPEPSPASPENAPPLGDQSFLEPSKRSFQTLPVAGGSLLAQVDTATQPPLPGLPNNTGANDNGPSDNGAGGSGFANDLGGVQVVDPLLQTESDMTFDEKINAETLEDLILETAKSLGLQEPTIDLSNPKWDGRSSLAFTQWKVRLSSDLQEAEQILRSLQSRLDNTPVWLAANQIGGKVAGDKTRMAIAAILASLLGIVGYVWIRFQHIMYGLAAVVALVHDVLITLGAIALSYWLKDVAGFLLIDEFKISLPVVAAFLTIIGYSLNDTIVVFDRIREVRGRTPELSSDLINDSINQTLSRTVLTSLTTLLAVAILYVIGGQGIHGFAFALLVGVIVGTYSSIFIASPALLWMSGGEQVSQQQREAVAAGR